ncbi:hypothetical protein [Streptomyces cyslabdanicus]
MAPQGPGCYSSSQVVAVAAVAATGSSSCREEVEHVLTQVSLT